MKAKGVVVSLFPPTEKPTDVESGARLKAINPAAGMCVLLFTVFLQALKEMFISKKAPTGIKIESRFFMVKIILIGKENCVPTTYEIMMPLIINKS